MPKHSFNPASGMYITALGGIYSSVVKSFICEGEPLLNEHNGKSTALTFPDEDPAVRAVVQNEAVAGLQGALGKRVLCCHQRDGHSSTGIRHLQRRKKRELSIRGMRCHFCKN